MRIDQTLADDLADGTLTLMVEGFIVIVPGTGQIRSRDRCDYGEPGKKKQPSEWRRMKTSHRYLHVLPRCNERDTGCPFV
jgi:hypothetical protein